MKTSIGRPSILYLAIVLLFPQIGTASPQPSHGNIAVNEAKKFLQEAIKNDAPDLYIDYYPPMQDSPGFYVFEVVNNKNANVSYHFGTFAVNSATGDVWDLQGLLNKDGKCQKLSSPSLTKIQTAFREGLKISRERYAQLSAQKPFCADY